MDDGHQRVCECEYVCPCSLTRSQTPTPSSSYIIDTTTKADGDSLPAFSGSFLILISLTSPVLSSVAALLTIFIVAIVDQLLPPPLNSPLTPAALVGGLLIIGAFCLLSWATYWEMDEERRMKLEVESDVDD